MSQIGRGEPVIPREADKGQGVSAGAAVPADHPNQLAQAAAYHKGDQNDDGKLAGDEVDQTGDQAMRSTAPNFCTLLHMSMNGIPENRAMKPGIRIQSSG